MTLTLSAQIREVTTLDQILEKQAEQLQRELRERFEHSTDFDMYTGNSTRGENVVADKSVDPRNVFVIHGRNEQARRSMFDFLRALKLNPIEWSEATRMTGSASPYIGDVLAAAFANAHAVVALFTGDDEAHLLPHLRSPGEPEESLTPQPRQNVLFEAGMAFGSHSDQVVLVEVGQLRAISDLTGRHAVRVAKGGNWRHDIADRLGTAACSVDKGGRDWLKAGAELEKLAEEASLPSSRRATAPIAEYSVREMRRLFGLFVEENTRGMPNPTTIDLKEEQRSDKAWARLTTKQMKAEIHQLAANKKLRIKIKSEVGAIIVLQWIRPPR
jgi:predicted nucleotide-binding protein